MHVFFHLNNSSSNKWFTFKIPSRYVYTIIPFPTCSPMGHLRHCAQILSCFGPRIDVWFIVQLVFWAFQLSSSSFCTTLCMRLGLPHPSIAGTFWCVCAHRIDFMGIHLLRCAHGNKHIRTHDAIRNTFVAIAWNVSFHVGWKQLHGLPSTTFNSSCWQVNIMLTKDGIGTLIDIVVIDPTQADLLLQSCATQGFTTSNAIQAKERSYRNRHLVDQFLPLVIEVFGCLQNMQMCFYTTVPMPFGAWRGQKVFIFLPWSLFFVKKFWSHYKGCKHLHFKLGTSHGLSYFPTSTPSIHTSHHHGRPIASHWFWTCKYGRPFTNGQLWTYIDFHGNFEPTWHPITSPFPLFYSFVHFFNPWCVC